MKKTIYTLIFVLFASVSFAQWYEQNSGTTHEFNASYFLNDNTGWFIGMSISDPIVLNTTDGGITWTPLIFPGTNYCTSVFFTDANNGFITDMTGKLFRTTNGGSNWTYQTLTPGKYLHEIFFTDQTTGYISGENGKIFKTTDGGTTWAQQVSGTVKRLTHIFFSDSQHGWAGGWEGAMVHTTDGGATWSSQTIATTHDVTGISFIDNNIGWAAATNFNGADAYILHTTDGGVTWSQQYNPMVYLNEITFLNANLGYVVGFNGTIYNTHDGGVTWNLQASTVTTTLNTVTFVNENSGWVGGRDGVILHTNNGGFPVGIGEKNDAKTMAISCSPNPAHEVTTLSISNDHPGKVTITVYDATGKVITVLAESDREAGNFKLNLNITGYAKGIYFIKMSNGVNTQMTKLMVN